MMSPKILVVVVLVVVVVVGVVIVAKNQGGAEKAPVQASAPPAPTTPAPMRFNRGGPPQNSPTKAF